MYANNLPSLAFCDQFRRTLVAEAGYAFSVESIGATPARAGFLDGLVEADPTIIGVIVGFLVVSAVLYVVFGMGKGRKKR